MAKTKNGVYHDLKESEFILNLDYGNDNVKFFFSSEFNLDRFNRRIKNYVNDETAKFNAKHHCKADLTVLLYVSLYKMIEKRGFYVIFNNTPIENVNGVLKVGV